MAAPVSREARLQRELAMLQRKPVEGVWFAPNPKDLGEWHVVLMGAKDTDYEGGYYHAIFKFPEEYPLKGPSIRMMTPSGRFRVNESICMSMTAWHDELWNPAWRVETIAVGFQSFMAQTLTDRDRGHGNVASYYDKDFSPEARRKMAADSMTYNATNARFVELFPHVMVHAAEAKAAKEAKEAKEKEEAKAAKEEAETKKVQAAKEAEATAEAEPVAAGGAGCAAAPAEPAGGEAEAPKRRVKRARAEPTPAAAAEGRYPKRTRGAAKT